MVQKRGLEYDLRYLDKAVAGIDPPPDPEDVEVAIKRMKTIYQRVGGLPSNQAATAANELAEKFHGAPANRQAVIGKSIIGVANLVGANLSK